MLCVFTLTTQEELECDFMSVAFSFSGRFLAAVSGWDCQEGLDEDLDGSEDGPPCSVHLWDTSSGMCVRKLSWRNRCISYCVGSSSPPLYMVTKP